MSFQQQPPRLVRWGFHPLSHTLVMIGLTLNGAICRVEFARGRKAPAILKEWQKEWPKTEFTQDKKAVVKAAGELIKKPASVKLYMTGTKFQQAVWKELLKIPQGKTLSYAEIARRIKKPKAMRAVGTACGANPVAILVPCHRVVASNGKLGGFGGGLPLKKVLLKSEGVDFQALAVRIAA
jgi:O-6-methylguanine DNA methyltransferase